MKRLVALAVAVGVILAAWPAAAQSSIGWARALNKSTHPMFFYSGMLIPRPFENVYGSRDAYINLIYYAPLTCNDDRCKRYAREGLKALRTYDDLVSASRIAILFRPLVATPAEAEAALVLACLPPGKAYPAALEHLEQNDGTTLPKKETYLPKVKEWGGSVTEYEQCLKNKSYADFFLKHTTQARSREGLHVRASTVMFGLGVVLRNEGDYIKRLAKSVYSPVPISKSNLLTTIQPTDIVVGAKTAPVKVYMYYSPDMQNDKVFFETTLQKFIQAHVATNEAVLIMRPYPWTKNGERAATVAHCVPEKLRQRFIEHMFMSQPKWTALETPEQAQKAFIDLAGYIGAPRRALEACVNNPSSWTKIRNDMTRAENELNFALTPTLYMNGKLMPYLATRFADMHKEMLVIQSKGRDFR